MSAETLQPEEQRSEQQRLSYFIEILIVATIFTAVRAGSSFLDINFAGSIAVVTTVLAIWAIRHHQGNSWADLGLKRPRHWFRLIVMVIVTIVTTAILASVALPLLNRLTGPLEGSGVASTFQSPVSFIAYIIIIAWGAAGFCEELIFRGFLLNQFARLFGGSKAGWGLALLFQAMLFGLGHYTQGLTGIIITGLIGLLFGVLYILAGRNLWCLILAHGIVDTLSLTQDYLGRQ